MSRSTTCQTYAKLLYVVACFFFQTKFVNDYGFNKVMIFNYRMDFESGEKVHMVLDNEIVGIGCVCRTDPNSTCGGTKIGQGNVFILGGMLEGCGPTFSYNGYFISPRFIMECRSMAKASFAIFDNEWQLN